MKRKTANPITILADVFDPDGDGYDYDTAKAWGMGPTGKDENAGHWGSVAPVGDGDLKKLGLPADSYVILKGANHPTFDKAVKGETDRGYKVIKKGSRFFSVPGDYEE